MAIAAAASSSLALLFTLPHPTVSFAAASPSRSPKFPISHNGRSMSSNVLAGGPARPLNWRLSCTPGDASPSNTEKTSSFCIIEGPETVQDFVLMQLQEIQDNIRSRRNKIFLLMEEVRRLRVQQRIKDKEFLDETSEENEMPDMPSTIPFLPHVTSKTLKQLYLSSFSFISGIIIFGGLIAPSLELKLGLGGTSYEDFIHSMHLPSQLSQVDPIVASFSGGAVGVISALMLVEVNNVEQQEKKRCRYCHGTGLHFIDIYWKDCIYSEELIKFSFFQELNCAANGVLQVTWHVLDVLLAVCASALNQSQSLVILLFPYNHQKLRGVQTAQELERLCVQHVFALEW